MPQPLSVPKGAPKKHRLKQTTRANQSCKASGRCRFEFQVIKTFRMAGASDYPPLQGPRCVDAAKGGLRGLRASSAKFKSGPVMNVVTSAINTSMEKTRGDRMPRS